LSSENVALLSHKEFNISAYCFIVFSRNIYYKVPVVTAHKIIPKELDLLLLSFALLIYLN